MTNLSRDKDCAHRPGLSCHHFNISKLQTFHAMMQFSLFRFAFRIYDIDNDGYISNGELFQVNISVIPNKEICIVTFIDSGVEDDGRQ